MVLAATSLNLENLLASLDDWSISACLLQTTTSTKP